MNSPLLSRLQASLKERQETGLYRCRWLRDDASSLLNFSSNDYLSLTKDSRLKKAYQAGYEQYPVGSGGSALVTGYYSSHHQLEQAFASALQVDDAVFFSSGYVANLSLMALLAHLNAPVCIDKSVHASIYDGIALSGVKYQRYRHCNVQDLQQKLAKHQSSMVLTETIFSMSGQIAPLRDLIQTSTAYHADVCVDEAHAFGVMGGEGLGLVRALHLTQQQVPLRVIPLGKAFAGSGAIIAGQKDWINALLQWARPYIYSTALSPALAYGLLQTLDVIRAADERRAKLHALIDYFRQAILQSEMRWGDSKTAIQQLQLGCPHRAQALSEKLLAQSILCIPIRQPTVSKQETGLGVILNYHHQPEDIDYLFRCIKK